MTLPTRALGVVWALGLCVSSPETLASPPPNGVAPLPAVEPRTALDDRLVLNKDLWVKAGVGPNVGLRVTFSWDGAPTRVATVENAGVYWRIVFPDRPRPGTAGRIEYKFLFEMNDANAKRLNALLAKLQEQTRSVLIASLTAGAEAAAKSPEAERIAVNDKIRLQKATELFPPVRTEIDNLNKEFATAEGLPPGDQALQALGFVKVESAWVTTGRTYAVLTNDDSAKDLAVWLTGAINSARSAAEAATSAECKTAILAVPATIADSRADNSATLAESMMNKCPLGTLAAAAPTPDGADSKQVEKVALAISVINAPVDLELAAERSERFQDAAHLILANPTLVAKFDALALEGRRAAYLLAYWAKLDAAWTEAVKKAISRVAETLTVSETAEEIAAQDGRRRMFDAALGFSYVPRLEDVIFTSMASICPWGCVSPDSTEDFGFTTHTLSFDIGLSTGVHDETRDRRHSSNLGFVLGASWNPVGFVRGSVGAYVFENEVTQRWNTTAYVGFSINVLHLGTLTGLFGQTADIPPLRVSPAP